MRWLRDMTCCLLENQNMVAYLVPPFPDLVLIIVISTRLKKTFRTGAEDLAPNECYLVPNLSSTGFLVVNIFQQHQINQNGRKLKTIFSRKKTSGEKFLVLNTYFPFRSELFSLSGISAEFFRGKC